MSGKHRYISPSEIASMDCWRAYRWKREGIRPRRQPKALNAGIAWDAFMGEWFRPIGVPGDMLREQRSNKERLADGLLAAYRKIDEAAEQADANFVRLYGDGSEEVASEKAEIEQLIMGMAVHFADTFVDAQHGVCRHTQFKVDAPLPSRTGERSSNKYRLHGYIDRIMERDGKIVVVDDKTTGQIGDTFFDDFQNDLQMPLYAYGMKQMGWDVDSIAVFAAAKKLPAIPEMRKTPFPVFTGELDAEGKPVQATEPVPCDKCDGTDMSCKTCEGAGLARFASGARKGELKAVKVTRHGLASLLSGDGTLNYTTTLRHFLEAIEVNELDTANYQREIEFLTEQGVKPFFQLAEVHVGPAMAQESAEVLRAVAPLLDKVPDAPMRNKFRCSRCVFQEACVITDLPSREEAIKALYSTREERLEQRAKAAGRCTYCVDHEKPCPDCGPVLTGMPDEAWRAEM